jgi:hypothetical protein
MGFPSLLLRNAALWKLLPERTDRREDDPDGSSDSASMGEACSFCAGENSYQWASDLNGRLCPIGFIPIGDG